MMLSNVSVTCFAASYAVTLALEISRLFLQVRVRWVVMIGFAGAGLFAHTAFLLLHTHNELEVRSSVPLSSWYDWCLLVAWVLVAAYLGLAIRRPQNTVGLFLLPLVLALVGTAYMLRDVPPFARDQSLSQWSMLHGVMLLLGTVAATIGFAAGLMYLLQAYRLKNKHIGRPGFRLPSLEWLHRFCRRSMMLSSGLLALGLLAGVALRLIQQAGREEAMPWTDPVALSSAVLFLWLVGTVLFEQYYKPARAGRKVAFLTLASFALLGLVLVLVLVGRHGVSRTRVASETLMELPHSTLLAQERAYSCRGRL